jgi:hypothetical protein
MAPSLVPKSNTLSGVELEWGVIDRARTYEVEVAVLVTQEGQRVEPTTAAEWKRVYVSHPRFTSPH